MSAGPRTQVQWFRASPYDLFAREDGLPIDGTDRPYGPNTVAVRDLLARLVSMSPTQIAAVNHRLDALPFRSAPHADLIDRARPMLEEAMVRGGRLWEAEEAFIDGTAVLTLAIAGDWPVDGLEWYWNDGASRPAVAAGTLAAAVAVADVLDPWVVTELEEPWRAPECPADDYFGPRTSEFAEFLDLGARLSAAESGAWVEAWWQGHLPPSVGSRLGFIEAEIERADPHREARAAAQRLVRAAPDGWLWDRVERAPVVRRYTHDNASMVQLGIAASGAGIAVAFGHLLPLALRDELLTPFRVALDGARVTPGSRSM